MTTLPMSSMRLRVRATVVALSVATMSTSAVAAAQSAGVVGRCDDLAANPADERSTALGVHGLAIDASAASQACTEALRADPGNSRIQYQLARAQLLLTPPETSQAIPVLERLASSGYRAAAYTLAGYHGRNGEMEPALNIYLPLVQEGDAVAMFELAQLLDRAERLNASPEAIIRWYTQAAETGEPRAQAALAAKYVEGVQVPRDLDRATELFEAALATDPDLVEAQFGLANLYASASPPRGEEAVLLLERAMLSGYPAAPQILTALYARGQSASPENGIDPLRFIEERAGSDVRGIAGSAQYHLGTMYERGTGVSRDYAQAASWYRQSSDRGDLRSTYRLGLMYDEGRGVPRDRARARELMESAAAGDVLEAMTTVGWAYVEGDGVRQDVEWGYRYLQRAGQGGDERAALHAALLLGTGQANPDRPFGGRMTAPEARGEAHRVLLRLAQRSENPEIRRLAAEADEQVLQSNWSNPRFSRPDDVYVLLGVAVTVLGIAALFAGDAGDAPPPCVGWACPPSATDRYDPRSPAYWSHWGEQMISW